MFFDPPAADDRPDDPDRGVGPPRRGPVRGPGLAQDVAPDAAAAKPKKNIIVHMIKSVGWVFGPMILAISVALVALIVLLFLDLRMTAAIPAGFVDEFTDTVNKRKFKEAFEMARNDPSFLGRVLTAGMSRLQYGLEDAREAADEHPREDQERQGAEEQLHGRDRHPRAACSGWSARCTA